MVIKYKTKISQESEHEVRFLFAFCFLLPQISILQSYPSAMVEEKMVNFF